MISNFIRVIVMYVLPDDLNYPTSQILICNAY